MWKYFGAAALLIASAFISKKYREYLKKRSDTAIEFLAFLRHIERKIKTELLPQNLLYRGFSGEILDEDFLPKLKENGELSATFTSMKIKVPNESGKILASYFADFGKSDLSGELERIHIAISDLEASSKAEADEAVKNARLFETLVISLALGLIILLI